MNKIKMLEHVVHCVLANDPETRSDNDRLYYEVAKRISPEITSMTMQAVFADKVALMPRYESVTRIRRKLQNKNPELRATDQTEFYREVEEEIYEEYSRM